MASLGQAQSLAMLVQQRELQNSKKLEALVLKNDELAESWQHAEKEREALLERLGYLDNKITEACAGLLGLKKDNIGMMTEHTSRLSYLEQGVEERFRLVEQQVSSQSSPSDTVTTDRFVKELSSRDKIISDLQSMISSLAQKVGGMDLRKEIESTTEATKTALQSQVSDLYSGLEVLDIEGKDVNGRVEDLEQQVKSHEKALSDKIELFEKRFQSTSSTAATVSTLEGRVNSAEGVITILTDQQSDISSNNQAAILRLEKTEQSTGLLLGRMSAVETFSKQSNLRLEDLNIKLNSCDENILSITNDMAVMDEKRRQKETQDQSTAAKLLELDRQDMVDIKKDVEILKDGGLIPHSNSSTADESRILSLVNELDRGKEVLESIVKMHEIRFTEMSEDLEKRIQKVEQNSIKEVTSYGHSAQVSPRLVMSETTSTLKQVVGHSKSLSPKRTASEIANGEDNMEDVQESSMHSVTAVPHGGVQLEVSSAKVEFPQTEVIQQQHLSQLSSIQNTNSNLAKHDYEQSVQRQEEWRQTYLTSASPVAPLHEPLQSLLDIQSSAQITQHVEDPIHSRHDPMTVAMGVKAQLEDRLAASRDIMEERRRLESELEKTNQQLSFIQMAFQTLAEKEGTLDDSKHVFNGWVKQVCFIFIS